MRSLIRVLMLLCLIGPAFGVNDFSGDSDFMCEWKFDDSALTVDSLGTNTLAVNIGSPSADTTNFKEGDASIDGDSSNRMIITDGDLDADFPLKNGVSPVFTVLFWAKSPSSLVGTDCLFAKEWFNAYSWKINHSTTNGITMFISPAFPTWEGLEHGSAWSTSQWYFVGASYDAGDKGWRIRVWDDTAGSILGGSTTTGTSTNALVSSTAIILTHSAAGDGEWEGTNGARLDDIIWCKRVLTDSEIDKVRAGTFGSSAGQMIIISKQLDWDLNTLFSGRAELCFDHLNFKKAG